MAVDGVALDHLDPTESGLGVAQAAPVAPATGAQGKTFERPVERRARRRGGNALGLPQEVLSPDVLPQDDWRRASKADGPAEAEPASDQAADEAPDAEPAPHRIDDVV